jgi:antitoxin ParD1/3/4
MKITLEVPPDMEAKLREYMAKHEPADVQRELDAAFGRALALLMLVDKNTPLSEAEFEALADELADHFEKYAEPGAASLPDEAFTRESIYGDHP